ncbi:hypothetical protein VM98_38505, partial [Streptomyces rubellomurinus subsp. indigoferus]
MRSRTLIRPAAAVAAVAGLAAGTVAAAPARQDDGPSSSLAWPQRLIDLSPDTAAPNAPTVQ